jgi:hypothetical protein
MTSMRNLRLAFMSTAAMTAITVASPAQAAVPAECSAARDTRGYNAGLNQGMSTVLQIWRSASVNQDINKCDTVVRPLVTTTIPPIVTAAFTVDNSMYTQCRAKGLLDGTVAELRTVCGPAVGACVLDGADWGSIAGSIYCSLSIDLGGLGDVVPWFTRPDQPGICESNFQTTCEDVYQYIGTNGGDALDSTLVAILAVRGVNPVTSYLKYPQCPAFTQASDGTLLKVFSDSLYVDCSYDVPQQP